MQKYQGAKVNKDAEKIFELLYAVCLKTDIGILHEQISQGKRFILS